PLSGRFTVFRPALAQLDRGLPLVRIISFDVTALVEPLPEQVLVVEVFFCGLNDNLGPSQAVLLPVEATFDHPPQNAGPFSAQFFFQLPVRLPRKWNDVEPSTGRIVNILQDRLVIANDG